MLRCRDCGTALNENNFTGLCGGCAYKMFQSAATRPIVKKREEVVDLAARREERSTERVEVRPPGPGVADEQVDLDIEMTMVNGFVHDGFVLGKALNEGFSQSMLQSAHARLVFAEVSEIFNSAKDKTIDPILIRTRLEKKNHFDADMKAFYDQMLRYKTPQLSQVLAYIQILKDQAAKADLRTVARKIEDYLKPGSELSTVSFVDFTSGITKSIRDLQRSQTEKDIQLVKSQMIEIAQDIAKRETEGEVECIGLSLNPFRDLTAAVSGLRRGFFYGIAGAPRRGKTTFTLELATIVATNANVPVLFFTWEQTKKNLTYRLLAKETRINPDTLQRKNIRSDPQNDVRFAEGWRKMEAYMNRLYVVEGSKNDTVDRLKAHCYNAMQDFQCDQVLLVCDYLQKMPMAKGYDNEKFRVEEISTDLKRLSIELNSPIIVISSLNKEGCMIEITESDDERPGLYHCKGSGDIEYDLDCAMVLTQCWGDTKELAKQMSLRAEERGKDPIHVPKISILDLHLDKNRDAPEGRSPTVQYFFFIEENRFFELGFKESDQYRYAKIEKTLNELEAQGFVKYRDLEGGGRRNKSAAEEAYAMGEEARKKIRLKRE